MFFLSAILQPDDNIGAQNADYETQYNEALVDAMEEKIAQLENENGTFNVLHYFMLENLLFSFFLFFFSFFPLF